MPSFKILGLGLTLVLVAGAGARAQEIYSGHYPQQTGQAIYEGICQGCHMPGALGAVGAGAYPALAHNPHLASGEYPALVILNGRKAMPNFGSSFSDAQIAAVVNYVRVNFGNHYPKAITPAEVAALRASTK
jgi:mono/diheme cytochrome c family protein